jgi:hypothetical protein
MSQTMQGDGMTLREDASQQSWMPTGLVAQAEPGGLGAQVGAERQGPLRGQLDAGLVAVQGPGLVIGRAAELEPVLPIQGEG